MINNIEYRCGCPVVFWTCTCGYSTEHESGYLTNKTDITKQNSMTGNTVGMNDCN